jgi:hypothetical protein
MSSITRPSSGSGFSTGYQLIQGVKEFQEGTIQTGAAGADADTTLTVSDRHYQGVTPTALRNYTLPTTSVRAGEVWQIANYAAGGSTSDVRIAVKASNGTIISYVYANGSVRYRAKQATPTTPAHWAEERFDDENWYAFTPTTEIGASDASGDFTVDLARWKRKQDQVFVQFYGHWVNSWAGGAGDFLLGLPLPVRAGAAVLGFNYRSNVTGYYQTGSGMYPVINNYAGSATESKTAFSSLRRATDPTYYGVGDGNLRTAQWTTATDVLNVEFNYESKDA